MKKLRFKSLQQIDISVTDVLTDDVTIDVLYHAISMNGAYDNAYVHLVIQTNGVNMWFENDENDEVLYLTEKEELYVMKEYAMHTIVEVSEHIEMILS